MSLSVSVIIPTLNAGYEIGELLTRLITQTIVPTEILVIDSSSDDDTESVVEDVASSNNGCPIRFEMIRRADFDHGGTRRYAASRTSGDIILLMTQDAVPVDESLIANLLVPFEDPAVAIVTGRQVAKPNASRAEQLVREFNYPNDSHVYSAKDLNTHGLKTYYTSDVCCAYRRSAYDAVGGFPEVCNTSEDMYVAIRAIAAGWKISYAAEARVLHSHNLTLMQQFRRNKAIGYFLEKNSNLLSGITEMGEGVKLARHVLGGLLREGKPLQAAYFVCDCGARLFGNRAGRRQYKLNYSIETKR